MNCNTVFMIFAGFSFVVVGVGGADPDPLTDFAQGLKSFTLRHLLRNGDVSVDSGGVRAATTLAKFPAMQSQGISMVRFAMVPCGVNLPHTHPRATEMLFLIYGGPLQVGFIDTRGRAFIDILRPGDVTIFPRGTLHFELNVGRKEAQYISALNSQNPGTLTSSEALFRIPARAVATALNLDLSAIRKINTTIFPYRDGLKKTAGSGCVPGENITVSF